jgi:hypothetical protein
MCQLNILKTDQTHCYDESGQNVPCSGSGQDGEVNQVQGAQVNRFESRAGVVTDRVTGLRWSQNASLATYPLSWAEALEYLDHLNRTRYQGIDSWRLPYRRELFSLISHEHINPALPHGHPFTEVFSGYYWTSSECRRLTDQAWYIHLGGGRIYRGMKNNAYMVWPVSSFDPQKKIVSGRFEIKSSTAYDRLTERMWLRAFDGLGKPLNWEKALKTIDVLNAKNVAGHADWRLPNIRELESLVDLNRHSPALAAGHPFEYDADGYWSATTSVYEKRYAWVLYPRDGAVGVGYKPLREFCASAVRSETFPGDSRPRIS